MHLLIKPLIILLFFSCISIVQEVNAGIFFNRRTTTLPKTSRYTNQQIPYFNGPVREWTWPGEINNHLRNHHHINTNGMSFQQMKHLHNVLHESGK